MKFSKIFLSTIIAIILLATQSFADEDRIGTAGAQELRIPFGARGVALGGADVTYTTGVEAVYYNPAGIANVQTMEAMFTHLQYIADMDFNTFGAVYNTGNLGTFAITGRVLSIGEIVKTTEFQPEGTGEILKPAFMVFGLTYGSQMTERVNIGATASVINESIDRENAQGLAFDFGVQYKLPLVEGLGFGIALKSLGPDMKFDGPDLEHKTEIYGSDPNAKPHVTRIQLTPFDLPTNLQMGLGYKHASGVSAYASFTHQGFAADEWAFGAEYSFNNILYLRGGYKYANQDDYLWGATLGFGINYANVGVDYTYGKLKEDYFDDNHWVTVRYGF